MATATIPTSRMTQLSKKDRKALRKQLVEKKQALLAKHNQKSASSASSKPNLPADLPKPIVPSPIMSSSVKPSPVVVKAKMESTAANRTRKTCVPKVRPVAKPVAQPLAKPVAKREVKKRSLSERAGHSQVSELPDRAASRESSQASSPLSTQSANRRHVAWPAHEARSLGQMSRHETPKRRARQKASVIERESRRGGGERGAWRRKQKVSGSNDRFEEQSHRVTGKADPSNSDSAVNACLARVDSCGGQGGDWAGAARSGVGVGGPLQRGAAVVEGQCLKVVAAWRVVRQWLRVEPNDCVERRSAFGSLPQVVWPLRVLGLLSVVGAVAMSVQAESLQTLVLGFGLGVAVIQLALAEIARGVWGLLCASERGEL